ncbi:two-component system sensor histidine kinase YesM [Breznakia blatticola]|uniref:histidine kinase n=1 Tax=Breznakia blatticola TaxID=1754012 RepID=A0A4R7ZRE0_9FIRM|nr:sensor histidine kinase [Breznakia blatticola]TDW20537.1 two-component system sensor histidine kinase YesM [Breznakia blatticola]
MFRSKHTSIKEMLKRSNVIISLLIIIPLVFNTVIYTRQILTYQQLVDNVSKADETSSIVKNEVIANVWDLVTGQTSVSNMSSSNTLNDVREQLFDIREHASTTQETTLIDVSLRTIETIEGYLEDIIYNLQNEVPVKENEDIMKQIVSVNDLLYSVLQDYVRLEINMAAQMSNTLTQTLIVLTIFQILIFIGSIIFIRRNQRNMTNKIEQPINDLVLLSKELARGNLTYQSPPANMEELEELTSSLNIMANDLQVLLKDNADKQYHLAQSELRVLQAQITPHFIYNTLDAIISLANQESLEDVKRMTFALSDFLRISLSKGEDWIPIEKEKRHIEDYLTILKTRYGAALEYTIDIPQEIMHMTVLKMILQPIVENAIYHGTKGSRRKGIIEIIGYETEESIVFEVKDNGVGMSEEKLHEVRNNLDMPLDYEFESGYGLYNVNRRLKLNYGLQARIDITSAHRKGTTMKIVLPKTKNPLIKEGVMYV